MGREIIVRACYKEHEIDIPIVLFEDFICGRNEATDIIMRYIESKLENRKEPADDASPEEWDDYYSLFFNYYNSDTNEELNDIFSLLSEEVSKKLKYNDKLESTLKSAIKARENCHTVNDFIEFTEYINHIQEEVEDNKYSNYAYDLTKLINKSLSVLEKNYIDLCVKLHVASHTIVDNDPKGGKFIYKKDDLAKRYYIQIIGSE